MSNLKREDTGTYDNTTEASDNTTERIIYLISFCTRWPCHKTDKAICYTYDNTTVVSDNTTELKREDTGTYDNTMEASDNTTVRKIYYYVLQLGQKDARLGYKS